MGGRRSPSIRHDVQSFEPMDGLTRDQLRQQVDATLRQRLADEADDAERARREEIALGAILLRLDRLEQRDKAKAA